MKDEKIIKQEDGSALILAVVLVSLLAIVGVLFIMVARVDKISASSIAENRQLNHAVDTVIAKISQRLAWDVPDPCQYQKYYDYPDAQNPWLASIEPVFISNNSTSDVNDDVYKWPQISDVTGYLGARAFAVRDVNTNPPGTREVIQEYPEIILDSSGHLDGGKFDDGRLNTELRGQLADADGDGIADSKWIELNDITTGKGKTIYAAIRVIDNLGMINANTAYMFDPNGSREVIDGNSQMQINLAKLARDANDTIVEIDSARNPTGRPHLNYQNDVIWNLGEPNRAYLPFDISDELDLRYRYCIPSPAISRLKNLWVDTIGGPTRLYNAVSSWGLSDWQINVTNPYYNRRHFLTNYNIDRIIDPNGNKMVNVNTEVDKYRLFGAIEKGLREGGIADANIAAQIAVNLIDFRDNDSNVTTIDVGTVGNTYYGFERPCVYISELAQSFYDPCNIFDPNRPPDSNDPNLYKSFAIELHKPYLEDNIPSRWRLLIGDSNFPVIWTGTNRFHVITNRYPSWKIKFEKDLFNPNLPIPPDGAINIDPNIVLSWPKARDADSYDVYFDPNFNDVNSANNPFVPPGQGRQSDNFYDPPGILGNGTYYWRIDDVNSGIVIKIGNVLRFTVGSPVPQDANVVFVGRNLIELQRPVDSNYITVDSVSVPIADLTEPNSWWIDDVNAHYAGHSWQRDISPHKCIRRLWDRLLSRGGFPSLGGRNNYEYEDPNINPIQAHPENKRFTNIGEVGMILRRSAYSENPAMTIGPADTEYTTRLNLADPNYQQIFKYLTAFDPTVHGADLNETRIKGRININTAPWYVLAQLPWASQRKGAAADYRLAQAIIAYRDKLNLGPIGPDYYRGGDPNSRKLETGIPNLREYPGFENVGELASVINKTSTDNPYNSPLIPYDMRYYTLGSQRNTDLAGFPDLTPGGIIGDGAPDDFEERDVIFSRISNLVTVRSDVYTAYILVRIGANGPQKRVIAILDRSNVRLPADKVKVLAVQQVPEAR